MKQQKRISRSLVIVGLTAIVSGCGLIKDPNAGNQPGQTAMTVQQQLAAIDADKTMPQNLKDQAKAIVLAHAPKGSVPASNTSSN